MSSLLTSKAPIIARMFERRICKTASHATLDEIALLSLTFQEMSLMTYANGYYNWVKIKAFIRYNIPSKYQADVYQAIEFIWRETRWARQSGDLKAVTYYVETVFAGVEAGLQCAKEKLGTPD